MWKKYIESTKSDFLKWCCSRRVQVWKNKGPESVAVEKEVRLPASYLCKDKEATSIARLKSDRPVCSKGALWVTTVPGFFFFFFWQGRNRLSDIHTHFHAVNLPAARWESKHAFELHLIHNYFWHFSRGWLSLSVPYRRNRVKMRLCHLHFKTKSHLLSR